MKKKFLKNNKGSSLVIVLIAVAFVSILTAIILSAALGNYRLRVMNNNSKKTFYSAETALEEVYAGLGEVTCDIMEVSYLQVAQRLSVKETVGDYEYSINISNKEANADLKKNYYEEISSLIAEKDANGELEEYLTSFLSDPSNAYVSSYKGKPKYDEATCTVTIEDVVIQYKEADHNYFSNVATDIVLKYPNSEFDFISNTKSTLETFLEYSIIAMDGVDIGYTKGNANATFAGGVFAGKGSSATSGITINDGCTLNVGNSILQSNIISAADVSVNDKAHLNFGQGTLWCRNINLGSKNDHRANVLFGTDTKVYASDDLNILGDYCSVTLGSDYNGYGVSFKGDNVNLEVGGTNSAIVINGKQSTIYAPALNRFVLAGSAYLNFEEAATTNYLTGESISIKGNQEIFLVPTVYMGRKAGSDIKITNPMRTVDETQISVDLTDFFAYELLNSSQPYVVKTVDGKFAYVYLNFKNDKAQQEYVKCVLSESYLESTISNKGSNWKRDRQELYMFITKSMSKFVLSGTIDFGYNSGAKVYAGGNLYEVGSNKITPDSSVTYFYSADDIRRYSEDKRNRYGIIQSFLYDIGSDADKEIAHSSMPTNIKIAGMNYSTADVGSITIYDRTVDAAAISAAPIDKSKGGNIVYENFRPNAEIAAVVKGGTYTVPAGVKAGVILGYDCNIVINGEFEGLVITNGKVYVDTASGALITNGVRDVASRILDEDIRISKYFYAYQMDTDNTEYRDIVDVKDLLDFYNWRKNYAD